MTQSPPFGSPQAGSTDPGEQTAPPEQYAPVAEQYASGAPAGAYGGAPYGPPTGYGHPYPGHQPPLSPQRPGNGWAVASLVVGIVALLLAWIPVVNVVSIVGGIVSLVLGIVAVRRAGRGEAGGKGLAIGGIVLSGLAIVGSIVVNLVLGAFIAEFDDALQQADSSLVTEAPAGAAAPGSTDAVGADGTDPTEAVAPTGEVLPLGESARIGEYAIAVDAVTLDANDIMATANPMNDAPAGQYVLLDVSVVYQGSEEGDPWFDLTFTMAGTDGRLYDDTSCSAIEPRSVVDVPTLTAGGAADYQVCLDVPPSAIDGAALYVAETISFDDVRAYWAIP